MRREIVGVSFAVEPGEAAYVPLAHTTPTRPTSWTLDEVLAKLRPLLEDPAKAKVGHHLKYDRHVLANHGIRSAGMRYDTMLESYVLNSTATRHDMDSVALKYLGVDTIHYEDVAGKGAKPDQLRPGAGRQGGGTPPRTQTSPCACTGTVAAAGGHPACNGLRVPRAAAGAGAVRAWSATACCSTCAAAPPVRELAQRWRRSRRKPTPPPATRSTSARRSSCRRSCSTS
jgi:hypothetical protein